MLDEPKIKLRSILNGWKHYLFQNQDIEVTAKLRAISCAKCSLAVHAWYSELIDDKITDIQGMVCNGCAGAVKCPLSSKLRSKDEKCPKQLW